MGLPKRLFGPALLGTSDTAIYTVPTGKKAVIRLIHATTPGNDELAASIGAYANGTKLYNAVPMAAQTLPIANTTYIVLEAGETFNAFAIGGGNGIALTLCGEEFAA